MFAPISLPPLFAIRTLATFAMLLIASIPMLAEESPCRNFKVNIEAPWPPTSQPVLLEARDLVNAGKAEAALDLLSTAEYDSDHDTLATRSIALIALGKAEEGLREIDKVLLSDSDWRWKAYRALLLLKLGREKEGIATIDAALLNADTDEESKLLLVRGSLHIFLKDYPAAISDYSLLIRKDPTAVHHLMRANACHLANLNEAAIIDYKDAIAIDPAAIDIRILLTEVYAKQGKTGVVCEVFTEACKVDPHHLTAARGFAVFVHKTESIAEHLSADEMRRVADHNLELALDSSPEAIAHAHYLKGQIYLKTGDLEVAEKHLLIAQGMIDEAEPQAKIRLALEDIGQRKAAKR
jgi:tetratricopeptide (TPR) repeat protein